MPQRFAELSGDRSGAICLRILGLLGDALEFFRQLFGAVRAIFWLCESCLPLDDSSKATATEYVGELISH